MEIITTENFIFDGESVVAIGKFDGLHKGHRVIIERAKAVAKKNNAKSVLFTFSPHPTNVLSKKPFLTLLSPEEKRYVAEKSGIDVYVEYPFTDEFSKMPSEHFVSEILINQLHCTTVILGDNFRFGMNQNGDEAVIRSFGIQTEAFSIKCNNNENISSYVIRQAVLENDLKKAADFLGYNFFIIGKVKHGRKIGRTLGFPTINIISHANKLLPENGVYATKTLYNNVVHNSITNIGTNPTVNGTCKIIETYIFDFNDDVYGKTVRIDFYKRLRGELKFESVAQLKEQINVDVLQAIKLFD